MLFKRKDYPDIRLKMDVSPDFKEQIEKLVKQYNELTEIFIKFPSQEIGLSAFGDEVFRKCRICNNMKITNFVDGVGYICPPCIREIVRQKAPKPKKRLKAGKSVTVPKKKGKKSETPTKISNVPRVRK